MAGLVMQEHRLEYKGREAFDVLEGLIKESFNEQNSILTHIITRNKDTEYLQKYMEGKTDLSEFNKVPVICYDDLRPYIQKIAAGYSNVLTSSRVSELLISAQTWNGEPICIPSIEDDLHRRTFFHNLTLPILDKCSDGSYAGKAMNVFFVEKETQTLSKIPVRRVLTSYYKSTHYTSRAKDPYHDYTTPDEVVHCDDNDQTMYCILLAGLVHREEVVRLEAIFCSAFIRLISVLQGKWTNLCCDIRKRDLDISIKDSGCRSAMLEKVLTKADPKKAAQIEQICSSGSWEGIISRLWPNAKYIQAVMFGTMSWYLPSLEHFTGKNIRFVCPMYAATESYIGVSMTPLERPNDPQFTFIPNLAYFEFIEVGCDGKRILNLNEEEAVEVVDLAHVVDGSYYELVVTSYSGLYRYCFGDVLQVTGRYNNVPMFRFICRKNVVLSVDSDKTSEEDLDKVMMVAKALLELHNIKLEDYTSYVEIQSSTGHYVLFWEIYPNTINSSSTKEVLKNCCVAVERAFDYKYHDCRSHISGPLEIRVVKTGTFEELRHLYMPGEVSNYATPRSVNSFDALKLLNDNVEDYCFSTCEHGSIACPDDPFCWDDDAVTPIIMSHSGRRRRM